MSLKDSQGAGIAILVLLLAGGAYLIFDGIWRIAAAVFGGG